MGSTELANQAKEIIEHGMKVMVVLNELHANYIIGMSYILPPAYWKNVTLVYVPSKLQPLKMAEIPNKG